MWKKHLKSKKRQGGEFPSLTLLPPSSLALSFPLDEPNGKPGQFKQDPRQADSRMKRATEAEQEESITGADRLHEAMESSPVMSKNKAANMHRDAVLGVQIGQNISVRAQESMNHDHPCLWGTGIPGVSKA